MKSNQILKYVVSAALLCFAACSHLDPTAVEETTEELPSAKVEIFAARGELNGALYEKYVLSGNSLWRECGTLNKKPTIQINPVETQADIVDPDKLKKISSALSKTLSLEKKVPLPPPDSPFGIGSGGAFELTVTDDDKVTKYTTSVDAVSGNKSTQLKSMNRLFVAMRSVGKSICGGGSFFGM